MSPKNKATTKSTKKGKATRKRSKPVVSVDHELDWTSGGEEEEDLS